MGRVVGGAGGSVGGGRVGLGVGWVGAGPGVVVGAVAGVNDVAVFAGFAVDTGVVEGGVVCCSMNWASSSHD